MSRRAKKGQEGPRRQVARRGKKAGRQAKKVRKEDV
jgi:hypothetical protein